jgi:hypothetical protein
MNDKDKIEYMCSKKDRKMVVEVEFEFASFDID